MLSQISIATYNGTTYNNDRFTVNGSLINIQLLSGTSRFRIAYKATQNFDRVEVRLNAALAGVFSSLNVYDAVQEVTAPVITTTALTVCQGSTATLTATAPAGVTISWYTAATGGTPVFTGATFTTAALNATTIYYASASRTSDGCTQAVRTPATVTVVPVPSAPVIANANATICTGQTATFAATAVTGVTIKWYAAATGGTALFTGNSYTTGPLTQTTSYYAEATSGSSCTSPARTKVTATVSTAPTTPVLTAAGVSVCDGGVGSLSVSTPQTGITYNWYGTATGGTILASGTTFTTPVLHNTTSYYVEASNAGGCTSTTRAQATVTVVPAPAAPTLAANNATINAGQTATIAVTNAQTGVTYNWYTSSTAGTSVFTGTTYTTPALFVNTTYYVGAVNSTGCPSATRTPVTINVTTTSAPCTFASQQTTNVNAICIGCGVTNAPLSTDGDTTTSSTINVLAGLLGGYAEQQLIFQQPGLKGDTIKLVLQNPAGLLSAAVLGQISVSLLNGTTPVSTMALNSALIKISLLAGTSNKYAVYIPATAAYDRITVRVASGVASVLTSLNIYYAAQLFPKPVFNPTTPEICKGSSAVINIASPVNGTFTWYTTPTGGTSVHTGTSYTTPVLNATTTYYVEYTRGTCTGTVRCPYPGTG